MISTNGDRDHTSKFSVFRLDQPKKTKVGVTRKVRITGKQKKEAERKSGGSAENRLATIVEGLVGKPIKIEGKDWHLYDNGIWRLVGEEDQFLEDTWTAQALDNRNSRTSKLVIGALRCKHSLKRDEKFYGCIRPDPIDENCYLINCPSNVLRIDFASGKVIDKIGHDPKFMFTSSLAVDYNDKATCPKFLRIAEEILPDENDRELLYLFFAYCIFPSCRLETALFCIGSGGNGKSLLTNAIAAVFGKDNRLSITLKEICKKDRKQLIRLDKKLVNLSTEVEVDPIKDSATFKMLVSGEDIETDRLYRGGLTINPGCKYCLLMNHMPEFGKGSDAEIRRTRIIHFPIKFIGDRRDPKLADKLISEKEGVLRLLIEHLPLITVMNYMPMGGTESKLAEEAFGVNNNPITAFVSKHLIYTGSRGDFLFRPQVFDLYCKFANDNNLENRDIRSVMRDLYEYYPRTKESDIVRKTMHIKGNAKQERIVRCLKLKSV
jgi:putative DNA primase/helicase